MTEDDIRTALLARLEGMSSRPATAWEDGDEAGTTPRLEVSFVPSEVLSNDIAGTPSFRGFLAVTSVDQAGKFAATARANARAVANRFPVGLALTGSAVVSAQPSVRQGFKDGAEYRVPVLIPYFAPA